MYLLEYAQFRNGRFVAWIEGGWFDSEEAVRAQAASRGLKAEGDDFLVSGPYYGAEGNEGRATSNLHDA